MFVQRKVVNKMDNKAFKNAVDLLVKEKGIDSEVIYGAMELALTSAYKKNYNSLSNVRVEINRETGDIKVFSFKAEFLCWIYSLYWYATDRSSKASFDLFPCCININSLCAMPHPSLTPHFYICWS